ncbi:MAG: DNA polymerase III subunit delta' [Actinobacteria bacterium]|nr:DNA polymerase III subunit delta' [Actinomycetota bacterium]
MSSIWDSLVGQDDIVTSLERAVVDAERRTRGEPGPAMTHAWLFTGPPGSGRSTAAACFAAALVCPEGGCGVCQACRTAPLGGHPDVDMVRPEGVSYVVKEARALVMTSELSPAKSFWHVMVVEDADRLTEAAVNALLKSIEEPPPHTVWILCAPSVEDVLPTIVSRTRHVALRTPSARDVADLLVERYAVDRAIAAFAARASQGHIGRARALATDEHARLRRQDVLRIPLQLHDIPSCFMNAANLISAATEDAKAITDPIDLFEEEQLASAYGAGADVRIKGQLKKSMDAAAKDLAKRQKTRSTRTVRDQIDRALVDLMGLYRDVLLIQVDSGVPLINEEMRPQLTQLARQGVANDTGRRLRAISYARAQVQANVTPLLAMESLMIELKDPWIRSALA